MTTFKVFALGSNGSGQLAIGHKEDVSIPTECIFTDELTGESANKLPSRPIAIAAGGNHTLLLCEDGSVYAAGQNVDGRCGIPKSQDCLTTFHRVKLTDDSGERVKVKLCSATWEASCFVTADDAVYACGTEPRRGLHSEENSVPKKLKTFCHPPQSVIHIASSMRHTLAVLSNGEVYGWGVGRKGQLGGASSPSGTVLSPQAVDPVPFRATYAVCGRDFSLILGDKETGQHIILGQDKWSIQPKDLQGWMAAAASWRGVHLLFQNGEIKCWGANDHGQHVPPELPSLQIAPDPRQTILTGSEHAIALSGTKEILAWGWGEHGNCGEALIEEGPSRPAWNVLESHGRLKPLGAGCATTWLVTEDEIARP